VFGRPLSEAKRSRISAVWTERRRRLISPL